MPETLRVLLIDDERIFVESLIKVLKRRGITVQSAHDGTTGVELFAQGEYDVVVLDMRMPGMDGLATFKAIRDRTRPPVDFPLGPHGHQPGIPGAEGRLCGNSAQALPGGPAGFMYRRCR